MDDVWCSLLGWEVTKWVHDKDKSFLNEYTYDGKFIVLILVIVVVVGGGGGGDGDNDATTTITTSTTVIEEQEGKL